MTTVTEPEPPSVTDLATAPLWHARRVTAGHARDVTVAAELLEVCGLLPAQLAGESAHLLDIGDFDKARALLEENNEEESMAAALDIAPEIDMSPATIRAWAKGQRLRVSTMGKVPQAIENAYLAAHGVPLAEQATIARPTAPALDLVPVTPELEPVTVGPATVTPEPDAVTVELEPVTVADLREQLDRLGAGYTDAVTKLNTAHAEVERLRADDRAATTERDELRAEVERLRGLADLPCPGTHCGEEAVCLAATVPTVVSTLPGPLPEELIELNAAWRALFAKASAVETPAGHTLAEVAAPALVNETTNQIHDLIRLLDGDTAP